MHEALRHHTLLQLKTVGPSPSPGAGVGNHPRDSNTKFRSDSGCGVTLRNILAGNRAMREYRDLPQQSYDQYDLISQTSTTRPYPVETATEQWANSGSSYTGTFTSPVSTVQRLMVELLGAADEFRRLHISASDDDGDIDGDKRDDEITSATTTEVSNAILLIDYYYLLICSYQSILFSSIQISRLRLRQCRPSKITNRRN